MTGWICCGRIATADLTFHGVVSSTKRGISTQNYVRSMGKPTQLAHSFGIGAKGKSKSAAVSTHHALSLFGLTGELARPPPNDSPGRMHKRPAIPIEPLPHTLTSLRI